MTDVLSDYLFTPSPDADENLKREGILKDKIFLVGDVMVDSLLFHLEQAKKSFILGKLGLQKELSTNNCDLTTDYCLLTLHRPSNVDNKHDFLKIIQALTEIAKHIPIIFPVHPRTRKQIEAFGFQGHFINLANNESPTISNGIYLLEPLSYLDFLNLMSHAKVVLTDSGGIQEETTVLNIPCITLRNTTERPITLTEGTNVLVHNNPKKIVEEVTKVLNGTFQRGVCSAYWDGHTAERIVEILQAKQTSDLCDSACPVECSCNSYSTGCL